MLDVELPYDLLSHVLQPSTVPHLRFLTLSRLTLNGKTSIDYDWEIDDEVKVLRLLRESGLTAQLDGLHVLLEHVDDAPAEDGLRVIFSLEPVDNSDWESFFAGGKHAGAEAGEEEEEEDDDDDDDSTSPASSIDRSAISYLALRRLRLRNDGSPTDVERILSALHAPLNLFHLRALFLPTYLIDAALETDVPDNLKRQFIVDARDTLVSICEAKKVEVVWFEERTMQEGLEKKWQEVARREKESRRGAR
ncbi:hypothetical protein JCM8547_004134 [Rhodosporidiobolus lusitaniae]